MMRVFRTAIVMTGLVAAWMSEPAARQVRPEVELRQAMDLETVKGDIKAAMAAYHAIAERYRTTDRATAAQSLLRLARLHERQGTAEAQRVYARIVSEFADQPAAVEAGARMARQGSSTAAPSDAVVWTGSDVSGDGDVSHDERWISDTDYESLKFVLRDLRSNTTRVLAPWDNVGASYTSTFSPDGRQLAYGWRIFGNASRPHVNEIRVIDVERDLIQPRRVYQSDDIAIFNPVDWSADGRFLAVVAERKDDTKQIAIVGVADGSYRALKTVGWRGPGKMFFSPDGRHLAYDLPADDTRIDRDVFIGAVDGSGEQRLGHAAIDVVMGWTADGRLVFGSDRSGAVGLWSVAVANGRTADAPVLVKPDIGTVTSLGTSRNGRVFLVKNASTAALFVTPIDLASGKLTGQPVLESFHSSYPGWSRDGRFLSYVFASPIGIPVLRIKSIESGQTREVKPALQYFRATDWMPDGRSLVTWGRDFKGRGGIYRIDAETGEVTLIVATASITGVQVSPDGRKIYHNENYFTAGAGPARFVERDLATGKVREIFRPKSRPSGATLSPDGRYLARIDTDAGTRSTSVVVTPVAGGEAITLATLAPPDEFERFISHNWTADSSAFVLGARIKGEPHFWIVPLTGGQPRQLDVDVRSWNGSNVRLSPSGRQIAYFSGDSKREVYAMQVGPASIAK